MQTPRDGMHILAAGMAWVLGWREEMTFFLRLWVRVMRDLETWGGGKLWNSNWCRWGHYHTLSELSELSPKPSVTFVGFQVCTGAGQRGETEKVRGEREQQSREVDSGGRTSGYPEASPTTEYPAVLYKRQWFFKAQLFFKCMSVFAEWMNVRKIFRLSNKKGVLEAWVLGSPEALGRPQVLCPYISMTEISFSIVALLTFSARLFWVEKGLSCAL